MTERVFCVRCLKPRSTQALLISKPQGKRTQVGASSLQLVGFVVENKEIFSKNSPLHSEEM